MFATYQIGARGNALCNICTAAFADMHVTPSPR